MLARAVGSAGRADGVDRDTDALATASAEIAELPQASVRAGAATASGLEPGTYDVVMCRHVLAHNGGNEAAIGAHLVDLLRPGGALYLVDVDLTMMRLQPEEPDRSELRDRCVQFHRSRGNDPSIGLNLAIDRLDATEPRPWLCAGGVFRALGPKS